MRLTRIGSHTGLVVAVIGVLILAGCKGDKTSPCGDQTCREGYTCDTIHDECVVPAQLELCVGEADGSECILNGADGFVCDQEVCLQSDCGDGILDVHTGEECDDGNNVDDDACPNNCTLNCGDGTVNPGEECDNNDLDGETCATRGFDSGQLTCELNCTFDESQCAIDCGNGEVHSEEGCDDDNTTAGDGCSDTCEVEANWQCQGAPSACTLIPYIAIAGGAWHVCAIRADDTVWCWGLNGHGQLTHTGIYNSSEPVQVTALTGVVAIQAGGGHTCAILDDGTVWCWGLNDYGQLGNGSTTDNTVANPVPTEVIGLTDAVDINLGGAHSCAVKSDTTVWCWGLNEFGQLGNGSATTPAVDPNPNAAQVVGLTGAVSVSAGGAHTCVIKDDDTIWCWGWNNQGQVGNNTVNPQPLPVQVSGLPAAVSVSAGGGHTCARLSDSTARCWGWNYAGQIGANEITYPNSATPRIVGLSNVESIIASAFHSCARLSDGTVWCWGANEFGQLGNGETTTNPNNAPVQVTGFTDAALITSKGAYTCSTKSDNTTWCWGANSWGQLGDGSTDDSSVPVQVVTP